MAILGYGFACEEMNVTVTGACFEGPGFEGHAKPDFLWQERDPVPWVALLWLPQLEPLSDGLGWVEDSTRAVTGHSCSRGG